MPKSQGDKHWENGEKALKKSLIQLRFSPDYVVAAVEFRQAATAYQTAGDYQRAVEALCKLAEVRETQCDYYEAGRCHEEVAIVMAREFTKGDESETHMNSAVGCFEKCGKIDAGVRVLSRLAEAQEERGDVAGAIKSLEATIKLYRSEVTERWYPINDSYAKLVRCTAAHNLLKECLKYMEEQNIILREIKQLNKLYKNRLGAVVIHMYNLDMIAADEVLSEALKSDPQFCSSREFAVASDAIDSYKDGDVEAFKKVMDAQTWTFLPVDLANLARKIPPPDYGLTKQEGSSAEDGGPPSRETGDTANWMM